MNGQGADAKLADPHPHPAVPPADSPKRPTKVYTLHRKLTVALTLLVISWTLILSAVAYFLGTYLTDKSDTLAALPIVHDLAARIEAEPEIDPLRFLSLSAESAELLPGLRNYIVDPQGTVITDLSKEVAGIRRSTIDPKPMIRFATDPYFRHIPAFAEDPGAEDKLTSFISVPLSIAGGDHYLFSALSSLTSRRMRINALDRFVLPYLLALLTLLVLLGYLASTAISYRLTRPLTHLVSVLGKYREGELGVRAPATGNDEVTEVAKAMNSMAGRIQQQLSELAERDALRRELIADVSHDLRGPVGVLRLCAEQLSASEEVRESEQLQQRSAVLERATKSLATLLSQLFELAKLETAAKAADLIPFPLEELLAELVERYTPIAHEKNLTLTLSIPNELPDVMCDPALIERGISNLLENALTYSSEGGTVELAAEKVERGVRTLVRDTGVGIAAEDLPHLFERSFRSKKWALRRSSSAGLGLAIVKRIIEAHGTEITVESKENEGSCFSFVLPESPSTAAG